MGRFSSMNRSVARSSSSLRSRVGWNSKSKLASVRRNGKRAKRRRAAELPVDRGRRLLPDHPGQELDVAPLLGLGFLGQGGEALGRAVEPQVPEVVFQLLIERVGHDPASVP